MVNCTLEVILMEDCGDFYQWLNSEKNWMLNFYQTLLEIQTVYCGEFLQHTLSNSDGRLR